MDWIQLIEIISSVALVAVTAGLLVSTNMYRKATEEMAKIQQQSVEVQQEHVDLQEKDADYLKKRQRYQLDIQVGRSRPTASKMVHKRDWQTTSDTFRQGVVRENQRRSRTRRT